MQSIAGMFCYFFIHIKSQVSITRNIQHILQSSSRSPQITNTPLTFSSIKKKKIDSNYSYKTAAVEQNKAGGKKAFYNIF